MHLELSSTFWFLATIPSLHHHFLVKRLYSILDTGGQRPIPIRNHQQVGLEKYSMGSQILIRRLIILILCSCSLCLCLYVMQNLYLQIIMHMGFIALDIQNHKITILQIWVEIWDVFVESSQHFLSKALPKILSMGQAESLPCTWVT